MFPQQSHFVRPLCFPVVRTCASCIRSGICGRLRSVGNGGTRHDRIRIEQRFVDSYELWSGFNERRLEFPEQQAIWGARSRSAGDVDFAKWDDVLLGPRLLWPDQGEGYECKTGEGDQSGRSDHTRRQRGVRLRRNRRQVYQRR